jgi:hypothetical protein
MNVHKNRFFKLLIKEDMRDMYYKFFVAIVSVFCFALAAFAGGYDSSNFSSDGLKWQPVPTGHIPGKDNGPGKGTHNAGEECGSCHRPGGKSPIVFTVSGTLYEDRAGRKPLKGGEIILQDINGNVISMISNEVGNFWTFAPIESNPYAVASHGGMIDPLYYTDEQGVFHPADPNDARSRQYKTWVRNGNHVRPMVTIAPVGGATDPNSRMSCSMHHSNMGSRGALWGAGKSTLSSYPQSHLSFKKHILPILKNKCVPCHIPGETWTRIVTQSDFEGSPLTKIDYSKSLDMTSYSGSSVTVNNTMWIKQGISELTKGYKNNPESSPVLSKTSRQKKDSVIHAGGTFWSAGDPDYEAIRQWIKEGAQNN